MPSPIQVGRRLDGTVLYLVDHPPSELPAVTGRDLLAAWDAARAAAQDAALRTAPSATRLVRFRQADGSVTDLVLRDRDARCWAEAVEAVAGLQTGYGLSLCLRLLALVELLATARWTDALCTVKRGGAELHPVLLRAAASAELTNEARFDERRLRAGLPFPSDPRAGAVP